MKKIIILLALATLPELCHAQVSSYATLYCINPSGLAIPFMQIGTPSPSNPPGVLAYGMNSLNQAVPLQCDASGNIIAGSFPTGSVLPATCSSNPVNVYGLVSGGTTTVYYCSSTNTWTAFGSGGGSSGTVSSGTSGQAAVYPSNGTTVQGGTLGIVGGGTNGTTVTTGRCNLDYLTHHIDISCIPQLVTTGYSAGAGANDLGAQIDAVWIYAQSLGWTYAETDLCHWNGSTTAHVSPFQDYPYSTGSGASSFSGALDMCGKQLSTDVTIGIPNDFRLYDNNFSLGYSATAGGCSKGACISASTTFAANAALQAGGTGNGVGHSVIVSLAAPPLYYTAGSGATVGTITLGSGGVSAVSLSNGGSGYTEPSYVGATGNAGYGFIAHSTLIPTPIASFYALYGTGSCLAGSGGLANLTFTDVTTGGTITSAVGTVAFYSTGKIDVSYPGSINGFTISNYGSYTGFPPAVGVSGCATPPKIYTTLAATGLSGIVVDAVGVYPTAPTISLGAPHYVPHGAQLNNVTIAGLQTLTGHTYNGGIGLLNESCQEGCSAIFNAIGVSIGLALESGDEGGQTWAEGALNSGPYVVYAAANGVNDANFNCFEINEINPSVVSLGLVGDIQGDCGTEADGIPALIGVSASGGYWQINNYHVEGPTVSNYRFCLYGCANGATVTSPSNESGATPATQMIDISNNALPSIVIVNPSATGTVTLLDECAPAGANTIPGSSPVAVYSTSGCGSNIFSTNSAIASTGQTLPTVIPIHETASFGGGLVSVTGVSGGSGFSGPGTIFLTAFNNCTGSTATVTLTSGGAYASAVVTAAGTCINGAPTSATCTSGTATCTGSPVSITVATTQVPWPANGTVYQINTSSAITVGMPCQGTVAEGSTVDFQITGTGSALITMPSCFTYFNGNACSGIGGCLTIPHGAMQIAGSSQGTYGQVPQSLHMILGQYANQASSSGASLPGTSLPWTSLANVPVANGGTQGIATGDGSTITCASGVCTSNAIPLVFGNNLIENYTVNNPSNGFNSAFSDYAAFTVWTAGTYTLTPPTAALPSFVNIAVTAALPTAGMYGFTKYQSGRQPVLNFQFDLSAAGDYANNRIMLGISSLSGSCSTHGYFTTSDTPFSNGCQGVVIRWSSAVPDTNFQCISGSGTNQQVQAFSVAPAATTLYTASVSVGATSASCTINGVTVTNSTYYPSNAVTMSDFFANSNLAGVSATVNLALTNIKGYYANGTF